MGGEKKREKESIPEHKNSFFVLVLLPSPLKVYASEPSHRTSFSD